MPAETVPHALTDAEYHAKTSAVLASVEAAVDRWLQQDLIDIDTQRTGGLLELSFGLWVVRVHTFTIGKLAC